MNSRFQDKLLKTFEAMYATGGPGDYRDCYKANLAAEGHREKEAVIRKFLQNWTKTNRQYDRCFYPFDDPRKVPQEEKIIYAPLDAASDDWKIAVEMKYSSSTPTTLKNETGGFWIPTKNYDHMKRFCGIDFKNARPFENGWFVYHFLCGEVYALSVKKFHYLVQKKCGKMAKPQDVDDEHDLPHLDVNHSDRWVVPKGIWTKLGNHFTKRYYNANGFSHANRRLTGCI